MELFFNLVWVGVSVILTVIWIRDYRRHRDDPKRVRLLWQLIALTALIVVLLPVISLTDDLQVRATVAETEHVGRRTGLQPFVDAHANPLTIALFSVYFFSEAPQQPQALHHLPLLIGRPPSVKGYRITTGTRPPPELAC
jgi:hypothetical protein